jgi:CBF1 interacting corepressor
VGTAWSHNFLNQKPWHPLNFRNQAKKFEAEQAAVAAEKAKEEALVSSAFVNTA